jgi:hypothetical protein
MVISDDELTALALAADPDTAVNDDAVSVWELTETEPARYMPEWYMPAPVGGSRLLRGWRRRIVILVVVSFVVIDAYGLCNTYGWVAFG